jgi:nucleoside-diphosphate-sugar epimerase
MLREAGYHVLGVDLKPCDVLEQDYRQLDLEDGACVHDVFAGASAVVHFGSLPTDAWTTWEASYRNLALGGYHVLQAAANLKIPRVVLASSPSIYGDYSQAPYLPIDEQTPACPDGIYGAAKQNIETLAEHYVRWHGTAIAALRLQRIVYEGSYEWRFRRYTENAAAAAGSLWSYVDARDAAAACLDWLQSGRSGFETFNIAADDVCVDVPTRRLLTEHHPHITDLRDDLTDQTGLVSCAKIKRMLV